MKNQVIYGVCFSAFISVLIGVTPEGFRADQALYSFIIGTPIFVALTLMKR